MSFQFPDETKIKSVILRILDGIPDDLSLPEKETVVKNSAIRYFSEMEKNHLKSGIVEVCSYLHNNGFFSGTSGNISVKLSDGTILITPSGMPKNKLVDENILKVNPDGNLAESSVFKPSSEIKMHIRSYEKRPDIRAVVHAHPPFSTGLASSGISPDTSVLPEALLILGKVPLVGYGTPSTSEIPEKLEPYLKTHNVFLLANHGALTLGKDLAEASRRMETLEFYAKVLFICRMLGGERKLSEEDVKKLFDVHKLNN
jgi:L-fuculose-phosphate aldolase